MVGTGILAIGKILGFNWASQAQASHWTEPTQAPPLGNVPPPLNVGPVAQTKEGGLTVKGPLKAPHRLKIPVGTDMFD